MIIQFKNVNCPLIQGSKAKSRIIEELPREMSLCFPKIKMMTEFLKH